MSRNADIEMTCNAGNTALHWAALKGNHTICEILIRNGANIGAKNSLDQTHLQCAAMHVHLNAAKVLISHQADVNALDSLRQSPLHWAVLHEEDCERFIELLLKHQANVEVKNELGLTPARIADARRYVVYRFLPAHNLAEELAREIVALIGG